MADLSASAAKEAGIAIKPLAASTLAPVPDKTPIDPKIQKVASEFESMVIGKLLAPMFEGLSTDGPFGGGAGEEMFRPLLIDEYAKAMTKAGGIGIADSVAREMMKLQGGSAVAATTAATSEIAQSGDEIGPDR